MLMEPSQNQAFGIVARRRTRLFDNYPAHNYAQAGRDLPPCCPHTLILFSPKLPRLALTFLLFFRRTLPGSSPGLLHRRRFGVIVI